MIGSATHGDGPGAPAPGPSRVDRILDLLDHPGQHYGTPPFSRVRVAALDPGGIPVGPFVDITSAVVSIGEAIASAVTPAFQAIGEAFRQIGEAIAFTVDATVDLLRLLYDPAGCLEYTVAEMGVARSDVRAVVLGGHRRCPEPHVWLWNHRRLPFPPGSGPALAWAL